ncbi:hypothetical protein O181_097824 [Austropuccinia psidii MF-1]|uniref:Uncharacterized protein n=1 Tax=Austropuccinia psidii MF-1 TaxID=1389203 RepID=A0A9Q3PDY5_9BASI|nr:hypothetical protein [Austropuccinia psidii MF-1]
MLWGLVYQNSIPVSPDYSSLKEFNTCFSFLDKISTSMQSTAATPLVPENQIITLRGVTAGKKKIAHGIINMTDFFIRYIQALLAKLGIRQWAPDLNDASDSLYNEACRISAIQTFRQIAAGGAFEYMNINLRSLNNIQLLEAAYNHIVFWSLAQKYKKEMKEAGKNKKDLDRGTVLRKRLRLKNIRYEFGVAQHFPQRYLKILANVDDHSDDEKDPVSNKYYIKNLECQSKNATIFMRRLDEEMQKVEQMDGKSSQQHQRYIPETPLKSVCTRVPKRLPIDFYNPLWLNDCPAGQKTITCDAFNIAFLPNSSESLCGIQHPDEKLSDRRFTEKYWDQLIVPYDISHEIPQEEELEGLDG